MMHQNLKYWINKIQNRLVVWLVLTLVLYIISRFNILPFVQIIAWFATAYCLFLLILLIVLYIKALGKDK